MLNDLYGFMDAYGTSQEFTAGCVFSSWYDFGKKNMIPFHIWFYHNRYLYDHGVNCALENHRMPLTWFKLDIQTFLDTSRQDTTLLVLLPAIYTIKSLGDSCIHIDSQHSGYAYVSMSQLSAPVYRNDQIQFTYPRQDRPHRDRRGARPSRSD